MYCTRNILDRVQSLHAVRAAALAASVDSLVSGASLTVTALGRHLHSKAKTKHNIKRMDRLLSNAPLHQERTALYAALYHQLCQRLTRPLILVDWSDIVEHNRILLIRAALVVDGRAIPLYESVYPLSSYNSPRTHARFLTELKRLLPDTCRPIVITDAGFRGPWFRAVQALGWDWIGRVRSCVNYRLKACRLWRQTTIPLPSRHFKIAVPGSRRTLQQAPLRLPSAFVQKASPVSSLQALGPTLLKTLDQYRRRHTTARPLVDRH